MINQHQFKFNPETLEITIVRDKRPLSEWQDHECIWAWDAIDIFTDKETCGEIDDPTCLKDLLIKLCESFVEDPLRMNVHIDDAELRNELEREAKQLIEVLKPTD